MDISCFSYFIICFYMQMKKFFFVVYFLVVFFLSLWLTNCVLTRTGYRAYFRSISSKVHHLVVPPWLMPLSGKYLYLSALLSEKFKVDSILPGLPQFVFNLLLRSFQVIDTFICLL